MLSSKAIRTPFRMDISRLDGEKREGITVSTLGLQNNNCVVIPGEARGVYTAFTMPLRLNTTVSGLRIPIPNGVIKMRLGQISASAPSGGYYFHEDGERLSDLTINPNEGVDIIGVGEGNSFKGWLVLNRFRYGVANSGKDFRRKPSLLVKLNFLVASRTLSRRSDTTNIGMEQRIVDASCRTCSMRRIIALSYSLPVHSHPQTIIRCC